MYHATAMRLIGAIVTALMLSACGARTDDLSTPAGGEATITPSALSTQSGSYFVISGNLGNLPNGACLSTSAAFPTPGTVAQIGGCSLTGNSGIAVVPQVDHGVWLQMRSSGLCIDPQPQAGTANVQWNTCSSATEFRSGYGGIASTISGPNGCMNAAAPWSNGTVITWDAACSSADIAWTGVGFHTAAVSVNDVDPINGDALLVHDGFDGRYPFEALEEEDALRQGTYWSPGDIGAEWLTFANANAPGYPTWAPAIGGSYASPPTVWVEDVGGSIVSNNLTGDCSTFGLSHYNGNQVFVESNCASGAWHGPDAVNGRLQIGSCGSTPGPCLWNVTYYP